MEGLPSINVNGGTTFLDEINASTQPGWTTGANNNLYDGIGFLSDTETAPGGIGGELDPATANQPPVASANGDPDGIYFGTVGSPVTFDGTGSSAAGSIVSYEWDFGDGNTGTGAAPSHTYTAAGTYTVSLTVTDDAGETASDTAMAEIGSTPNVPPVADPNGPYTGTAGIAVSFDGSGSSDSDGSIVSYSWDFGDGSTGTGVTPSYTYAAADTYTVSLTVTDDGGATHTETTTATIVNITTGQPGGGDGTIGESVDVEVKVLKTIKREDRIVTLVKLELAQNPDLRLAEILCGPDGEGAQLVAPKRLIQKKDGGVLAVFRTNDLGIQFSETQFTCMGTLEPDGTPFMGTSNQVKRFDRNFGDEDHDHDGDRDDDDDDHDHDRDDDDDHDHDRDDD